MSLFGHKHRAPSGYGNGAPYGRLDFGAVDGMGVLHVAVRLKCETCGQEFDVVKFHTKPEFGPLHRAAVKGGT
jgi:hypothetical protein